MDICRSGERDVDPADAGVVVLVVCAQQREETVEGLLQRRLGC
jgi:hypothetical protein